MRVTISVYSHDLGDVSVTEENPYSYYGGDTPELLAAYLAKAVDKINRAYWLSDKASVEIAKSAD